MRTAYTIFAILLLAIALSLLGWTLTKAEARDTTGLSAQLSQEQKDWVRGLRGPDGISCCDDADGIDPVWRIENDRYVVHYKGQDLIVDPKNVLTVPNKIGVARAWVWVGLDGNPYIRCFLPGPTA